MKINPPKLVALLAFTLVTAAATPLAAQTKYKAAGDDAEIKVGNIMPYTGPAAAYGLIGRTIAAYFKKINAEGGIDDRKINFISYDDSYDPAKAIQAARTLVEDDQVLLVFQSLGTLSNTAIQKYLNARKVPQLFVASGATKWDDPDHYPWTMGWQPNYQTEGRIFGQYLLENHPHDRIAILYQNDDYGKDYVKGLKDSLAGAVPVIAEAAYETTDPDVNAQMAKLKASGADIFFNVATPKFAAQAIRRAAEIGWKPLQMLNSVSNSVGSVLKPAGLDNAQGILTANYMKEPGDPLWKDDPAYKEWLDFMDRYFPDGDKNNTLSVYGYSVAQTLVYVLRQCGDQLTRENVMKQAANLKGVQLGMLLPGILNVSPNLLRRQLYVRPRSSSIVYRKPPRLIASVSRVISAASSSFRCGDAPSSQCIDMSAVGALADVTRTSGMGRI